MSGRGIFAFSFTEGSATATACNAHAGRVCSAPHHHPSQQQRRDAPRAGRGFGDRTLCPSCGDSPVSAAPTRFRSEAGPHGHVSVLPVGERPDPPADLPKLDHVGGRALNSSCVLAAGVDPARGGLLENDRALLSELSRRGGLRRRLRGRLRQASSLTLYFSYPEENFHALARSGRAFENAGVKQTA